MNQAEMISLEREKIQKAIQSPEVKKIYFNGFSNSISGGDILLTLFKNGEAIKVINTSFTVAKTLAIKLKETIDIIEKKTGSQIMTTDFIQIKLVESEKK